MIGSIIVRTILLTTFQRRKTLIGGIQKVRVLSAVLKSGMRGSLKQRSVYNNLVRVTNCPYVTRTKKGLEKEGLPRQAPKNEN